MLMLDWNQTWTDTDLNFRELQKLVLIVSPKLPSDLYLENN